ncbi:MAG: hypothetical protein HWN67_18000 [Candidatus Helarchaeota archaeon]|nr:hypothetical protein [Candidatus Helarchaeota archaeon]
MNVNNERNDLNWLKEEKFISDNTKIIAFLTEFNNGVMIFLTDKNYRIGTIAIAVPMKLDNLNQINSSTIPLMFGVRNELITRAIAEKIAKTTNKLSIAITNFASDIKNHYNSLFDVINKLLNRMSH